MGKRSAWSGQKEEAALLVAQGELTGKQIAERVGISVSGLDLWKLRPDFQARVQELVDAMAEAVMGRGIAERENRVAELNEEWNRLRRLRDARAAQYADVPGGDTGLVVRQVKLVRARGQGSGGRGQGSEGVKGREGQEGRHHAETRRDGETERGFVEVAEYVLDVGLLRELREHGKQAARELGQWEDERQDESAALVREYVGVAVEEV